MANLPIFLEPEVERYLKDISKTQPFSPEEEKEVSAKIKEGDREARDKLVEANLRFVVTVAQQYQGRGLPLMDLIGVGNTGLLEAAERFDAERGYKFISYAVWWVRQAILQALAEQTRTVRIPLNKIALLGQIRKAQSTLEQRLEGEPTLEEIAQELGVPADEVRWALDKGKNTWSLDQPFNGDEDKRSLLDTLEDGSPSPEEMALDSSLREVIEAILKELTPQEAEVISRYFGLSGEEGPQVLDEIGAEYGLTRERIRQIKEKALARLRHPTRKRQFRPYLEE